MDQITEFLHNNQINPIQLIPVLLVFVGALLVFIFGFKKPVQPPFKKLLTPKTKAAGKQKREHKSKSASVTTTIQNGNIVNGSNTAVISSKTDKDGMHQASVVNKKTSNLGSHPSVASSKNEENKSKKTVTSGSNVASKKKDDKDDKSKKIQQQQQLKQNDATGLAKKANATKTRNKTSPNNTKSDTVTGNRKKDITIPTDFKDDNDGEWKTVLSKTEKKKKSDENVTIQSVTATAIINDKKGKKSLNSEKKKDTIAIVASVSTTKLSSPTKNKKDNKKRENLPKKVDTNSNITDEFDNYLKTNDPQEIVSNDVTSNIEKEIDMDSEQYHEIKNIIQDDDDQRNDKESTVSTSTTSAEIIDNENQQEPEVLFNKNNDGDILKDIIKDEIDNEVIKSANEIELKTVNTTTTTETETTINPVEVSKVTGNIVFDELGDSWTETKPSKKQRKKIRKE